MLLTYTIQLFAIYNTIMATKIKLFKSPLIEDLEKKVNSFLSTEIGKFNPDGCLVTERVLKDIQYVKDISDSAVMIVYEEDVYKK